MIQKFLLIFCKIFSIFFLTIYNILVNYAHILLIKTLLNLKNIYISKNLQTGKYYANLEPVHIVYELKLLAKKKLKTVLEIIQNWKRRIGYVNSVIYV